MGERKSQAEMIADLLREAGVLVLVFGILDEVHRTESARIGWLAAVGGVSLALIGAGIAIERKRGS